MPGIKRRLYTIGTARGRALFGYEDTCEACGCLIRRQSGSVDRFVCSSWRCGIVVDPIPASEVGQRPGRKSK